MKFIHKFNRSLCCEMQVADTPPEKGHSHIRSVQWTGQPKHKHRREYIRFCHLVNSHLADHWQMSLLHLFLLEPKVLELWEYHPGQAPKRVSNINTDQGAP